jgi:predicted patatin/cPLA2 family phospholipase
MNPSSTQAIALEHLRMRRERVAEGIHDGRRLGLIVQGGGMRGVYSMAVLSWFERLGLSEGFDCALGSSSGALNAAYMLAGQSQLGLEVYLDEVTHFHMLDPFRPARWGDIDVLIENVITTSPKALDIQALRASPTELHVVLTSCRTGEPKVFSTRDDVDLIEVLRATAAIPVAHGVPVRVGDECYVDGALVEALPLTQALALGCTDLVVVLTRPLGSRVAGLKGLRRLAARFVARNQDPLLQDLICRPDDRFNAAMSFIEKGEGLERGVHLAVIAPSDQRRMVSSTTTNRRKLEDCVAMAREDVEKALGEKARHPSRKIASSARWVGT